MIYLMYKSAKFGLVLTVTYLQIYICIYDASLQSYWNVKFMKNAYVFLCQHFFGTLSCNNSVRSQITIVLRQFLIGIQCTIGLCKLNFN